LIDLLAKELARGQTAPADLLIGLGDDCAAWRPRPGRASVITTDALVENIHFDLRTTTWFDLGWKSMAANISDIAAMGAQPRFGLITLGFPPRVQVEQVTELYRGMRALGDQYDTYLVGGDTVGSPDRIFINVVIWGETEESGDQAELEPPLLRRSTAKPGDLIAVTGFLGTSLAGLKLLQGSFDIPPEVADVLTQAHLRPRPRVREGLLLVREGLRTGMDLSDGLLGDLKRITQASGVGAAVHCDRLPVHPAVRQAFPDEYRDIALIGGEDYELLCAAPEAVMRRAQAAFQRDGAIPLTVIGQIGPVQGADPIELVDDQGRPVAPPGRSYEHFG
jgi:thiamine-monophosphate kinase